MEERTTHQAGLTKKSALISFLGGIKEELGKITWTERGELLVYTRVVFASVFIGGFLIYAMDLMIRGAMVLVTGISRLFGG